MKKYLFEFYIKENYFLHFKEELLILKERTIKENGCLLFDFLILNNCFIILEYWDEEIFFKHHLNSNHLLNFRKKTINYILKKRIRYEIIEDINNN